MLDFVLFTLFMYSSSRKSLWFSSVSISLSLFFQLTTGVFYVVPSCVPWPVHFHSLTLCFLRVKWIQPIIVVKIYLTEKILHRIVFLEGQLCLWR